MLKIVEKNDTLVVDSRLVATELEIQHKNLVETIRKYQNQIESTFGGVAFETETIQTNGVQQTTVFYYLTEDQALFIMTLCRDPEAVVRCKAGLVKAFSDAKKLISNELPPVSSAEYLLLIAQNMVDKERRLKKLEQEQQEIKSELDIYTETLGLLPRSDSPALKTSERQAISQLVRSWSVRNKVDFIEVWNRLYKELKYNCRYDVTARARNSGKNKLDLIEEAGLVPKLYAIASEILV